MNTRTRVYMCTVTLAAAAILAFQGWSEFATMQVIDYIGVLALVALGLLSEGLAVRSTIGSHQAPSSIAFLPYFASVLLFPTPASIVVVTVTTFTAQLFIHKNELLRSGFNTAQTTLALVAGNFAFEALGGRHSIALQIDFHSITTIASFVAMAFLFFVVNQSLVGAAIAFATGSRISTVLRRTFAPTGFNFFYDMMVSPVAIIVALVYSRFNVPGIAMVSLPLLIIRHSYAYTLTLQQANKDILTVLVKTIETRDPYTSGHSIRVSILARAIAEDMKLSPAMVDRIETTAMVHDIGKIDAVYASIIRKEGSLTESERKTIATHAASGAEFLKTLSSFTPDVVAGVRHHHERFDGTGYPDGLAGDSIPLASRIIMLCDSMDAMLSDRPYRKALPLDQVRAELMRCAGTQFDPKVVEVILRQNTLERAAALVRPESYKPKLVAASA